MQKRELLLRFAGLWVGLLCLGHQTTAQSVQGAAFDPTPVPLDRSEGSEWRTVTPMDLLTLRDPKGLSTSPDGKYIAFVLGQAVYETNAYRSGLFVVETGGKHSVRTLGTAGMPHWDGINQWIAEPPQWAADGS